MAWYNPFSWFGGGSSKPKPKISFQPPTQSPTGIMGGFGNAAIQGAKNSMQSGGIFDKAWNAVGNIAKGVGQGAMAQFQQPQSKVAPNVQRAMDIFSQGQGTPAGYQPPSIPTQSGAKTGYAPGQGTGPISPQGMAGPGAGFSIPDPTPSAAAAPALAPQQVVKKKNWFDELVAGVTGGAANTVGAGGPAISEEGATGGGSNVFNRIGQQIPGAALSMFGDAMAPGIENPAGDIRGIADDYRARAVGDVMSPEKRAALDKAMAEIQADPGTPPEGAFTLGDIYSDEQLQDDLKAFDNAWKAARPGADIAGDSDYQRERSRIVERAMERRTAARDQETYAYQQAQQQRQQQYVQQVLNLDQVQMEYLMRAAEMDMQALQVEFDLSAKEAAEFKELFSNLGGALTPDREKPIQEA